jgi:hypothetical protein
MSICVNDRPEKNARLAPRFGSSGAASARPDLRRPTQFGRTKVSIFGSIMSKIFGTEAAAAVPVGAQASTMAAPAASPSGSAPASATATPQPIDVAAVLGDLASKIPQELNWRTSIVDLMKLLNLDSSLNARKELAQELHYTGDMNDSAAMNTWLHQQVMQKLAENGGKVPDELKS